jgi:hypothetical protein
MRAAQELLGDFLLPTLCPRNVPIQLGNFKLYKPCTEENLVVYFKMKQSSFSENNMNVSISRMPHGRRFDKHSSILRACDSYSKKKTSANSDAIK